MAAGITISLAGRVSIGSSGREAEAALGPRARVALAYLVLARRRPVPRDELAEVMWGPELPPTWRAALRGVISRLRVALAAAGLDPVQTLTSGPGGYHLCLPPGSTVDVEIAQATVLAARAALGTEDRVAYDAARRAVTTLHSEFLPGAEGPWVERRQAEIAEVRLEALELLSRSSVACGDNERAVWAAEEAAGLQPLRESAHVCVMAAHEAAGNRARALRAYERCRRLLADELGVTPAPETEAAYVGLLGDEPPRPEEEPQVGNLPVFLSRFIGRLEERAEVVALASSSRLLTLTGTGGAGKSRLGLEVARELSTAYRDGTWLIELAGLGDPRLLADHMNGVLGVADGQRTAVESLTAHLEQKRLLLILDNCEHLVSACASMVDQLLRCCGELRIIATSREPLSVAGETVWAIPPLSCPGPHAANELQSLLEYDAVALFVDRALAAAPVTDLAPVTDAVTTICRRLDGLPLAIELAAARVRSMALPDIAERLDDRFRLLVGGLRTAPARHQTLRAALDWSYEALSGSERRLFSAVSVFASDFTIEAAEAVNPDGASDALDALTRLVDKSLVVADRSGRQGRYRLLETMRQYGYEMLVAAGAEDAARAAQMRWAAALVDRAEVGLEGSDQPHWLSVLDGEHDNVRGALDWAAAHPGDPSALRAAASLWRYWEIRGYLSEGRSRLEVLLQSDAPSEVRAKALNSAGVLAQGQGENRAARCFYEEALHLRRGFGDLVGMAAAMNGLGNVAVASDDLFGAREIFQQNLATSRQLDDPRLIAASLMNLGVVTHLLFVTGRIDAADGAPDAHALHLESLEMYRQLGDTRGVSQALENLGAIAPYRGDDAAAHVCLNESLQIRRQLRDKSGIAASARFLGHLALRKGEYETARTLHEECLEIENGLGNTLLMAADLASLAEIASGEGDRAEACRLVEAAEALRRP